MPVLKAGRKKAKRGLEKVFLIENFTNPWPRTLLCEF